MGECANYSANILDALVCAGNEPELLAVMVSPLQEALAACLKTFITTLDACGRRDQHINGDKHAVLGQEVAVCKVLGKVFEKPEARQLCAERFPECVEVLAQTIARHPTDDYIQVHAQWALSHLAGLLRTLEVVRPFFSCQAAVSAFLWIAAEAKEELEWESTLIVDAMQRVTDADAGADMHTRCFELIGARLRADHLEGNDCQKEKRYRLAAESVPVLVHGIARWLPVYEGRHAVAKASEALWKVCRGSAGQPVCNPHAQQRLSSLENEQHILMRALQDPMRNLTSLEAKDIRRQLSDLLGIVTGLPGLVAYFSSDGPVESSTDTRKLVILSAILSLPNFLPSDAANAVHVLLAAVGKTPSCTLLEPAVKALAWLMEGMQMQLASVPANEAEKIVNAIRCAAQQVLTYMMQFLETGDGWWPSMSGRALRAAAFADTQTSEALGTSEQLQVAVERRIKSACQRCDSLTYSELENTFAITLTIWGVGRSLRILHDALEHPEKFQKDARHSLIQSICRVLVDTEEEMKPQDAKVAMKVVLRTKDKLCEIQELETETFAPMAAVLGHCLKALGHSTSTSAGSEQEDMEMAVAAVTALVWFLDSVQEVDDLFITQEICRGVCVATSACAGVLVQAGVREKLETIAEKLVSRACAQVFNHVDHEFIALAEVLEALGRLNGSVVPVVSVMQRCQNVLSVQIACLRSVCSLLDDGASIANSQEGEALLASCRASLVSFGDKDERVRCSAERIIGLVSHITR